MGHSDSRCRSKGPPRLGVAVASGAAADRGRHIAASLGLPLVDAGGGEVDILLLMDEDGLGLTAPGSNDRPVRVELAAGGHRLRQSWRHDPLVRALAAGGRRPAVVIDGTGGLGRDAAVLAGHGCTVHLVERHPVLAAMLADGIRRLAAQDAATAGRIILHHGDARRLLPAIAADLQQLDGVYLDPMFPARTKSALVKKEMRLVGRLLAGTEPDEAGLLAAARGLGVRVVVKRPRLAPDLAGVSPHHRFTGRACRFDLYLPRGTVGNKR